MRNEIIYVRPTVSALDLTKDKIYRYHPDEDSPNYGYIKDDSKTKIYIHAGVNTCVHLNDKGYFIKCDKQGLKIKTV